MKHFEIVTCWCITVNTGTLDVDILEEYTHQHRPKQFTSDFVPIQKKSLLRTCDNAFSTQRSSIIYNVSFETILTTLIKF